MEKEPEFRTPKGKILTKSQILENYKPAGKNWFEQHTPFPNKNKIYPENSQGTKKKSKKTKCLNLCHYSNECAIC